MQKERRSLLGIISCHDRLSRYYRIGLFSLSVLTLVIVCWKPPLSPNARAGKARVASQAELLPEDSEPLDQDDEGVSLPPLIDELDSKMEAVPGNYDHWVSKGDTLEAVLSQYGVDLTEIARLARQFPALRYLHIGQRLRWQLDDQRQLQSLKWQLSPREIRYYERGEQHFTERCQHITGVWQQQQISGIITSNFANSARDVGLSPAEIQEMVKAFQWQFNFRQLRSDDQFDALFSREFLEGKNANSQLLAARFRVQQREYYAVRGDDGRFYDQLGQGLAKGFLRLPTLTRHPVSSAFNPKRRHPVTGRLAPHHGVDFAMPRGTPVVTVGDGEVVQSGFSHTAGHYLTIRHGRQYITRYFHLQKRLVTTGQRVKRGQKIALSGNSGRSTGPHLHFELHINRQPVNPLTARLPAAEVLVGSEKQLFLAKVQHLLQQFP